MATALSSGRRWCVSGTPITNNFKDLIGQFRFLHLSDVATTGTFNVLLGRPRKLLALLRRIVIRHSKSQRMLPRANGNSSSEATNDDGVQATGIDFQKHGEPLLKLPKITV